MVYADDGWSSWGDWLDSGTICYLQGQIPTIRAGACLRSHFGLKVVGRLVRLRQVRQTSKRYTHQARKNVRKKRLGWNGRLARKEWQRQAQHAVICAYQRNATQNPARERLPRPRPRPAVPLPRLRLLSCRQTAQAAYRGRWLR